MKKEKTKEKIIEPTTGNLGKKIMLNILNNESENIKSISSVYHKINTEMRFKITVIVSEEPHYEDV